ncbi:MAG: DUF885 domain-containing protein [Phycisphaerales bacterium]|nr:DUF885 domain-containing protein [Phycisphaerales bacterium]
MTRMLHALFVLIGGVGLAMAAAAETPPAGDTPVDAEKPPFAAIAGEYLTAYWRAHPFAAAEAGLHEYDGKAPDWSTGGIERWVEFNRTVRRRLDDYAPADLNENERVDREILRYTIGGQLFDFADRKSHRRDPMTYDVSWGLLNFIRRDYAPLATRMKSAVALLEATPGVMEAARKNLDEVLPLVVLRTAIDNLKGSADFIRSDLADAFKPVADDALRSSFKSAAGTAAESIDTFVRFLESERKPKANDAFAIGAELFGELLRETEGVDIPLDRLLAIGQADLDRNLARAGEIVRANLRDTTVGGAMAMMKDHAYAPNDLIPAIAKELNDIRRFCIDRDLITIPSKVGPTVGETPKFARWASAMMSAPGPFETVATEAYYDVTPVDPAWSQEKQDQWLRDFNRYIATNVSVHEAYPGHYVQGLHTQRAPTDVQKAFSSYAAVEGWAHYTEQMMVEAGFHADMALYELAQIQDALLRNCRFLCAIRMHTDGMSVDEATKFFQKNTFLDKLMAEREAERGTYDPAYFKYTLGKLQILRLRDDFRKKAGEAFSLRKFHDDLLSRGMPPLVVTRERLLGATAGPGL